MRRENIFSVGEFDDEGMESGVSDELDEEPDIYDAAPDEVRAVTPARQAAPLSAPGRRPNGRAARIRTRPMPARVRAAWPLVATMLITNIDGSQILFVRPDEQTA